MNCVELMLAQEVPHVAVAVVHTEILRKRSPLFPVRITDGDEPASLVAQNKSRVRMGDLSASYNSYLHLGPHIIVGMCGMSELCSKDIPASK